MKYYGDIEERKRIIGFPRYEITTFGRVLNIETGRDMVLSPTMDGDLSVGMMYEGRQYRRSVKVLVARAFIKGETEIFNTPILLDNDKHNLRADNIVWRPRWFAYLYSTQFLNIQEWVYAGPIVDTTENVEYENILEASIANGLLFKDVRNGILNQSRIFPTGQIFIYNHA